MRTGCAVVPAPEFPALFSSAIQLSSRPCCISRYCNRHRNSSLQGSVSVSGTGVNQVPRLIFEDHYRLNFSGLAIANPGDL